MTFPVLWICGPSGVGKSTVGHELYRQLPGAAFVDLDQIGLCYPVPGDDPRNHRLRASALGRLAEGYRAAGARCLVTSGLVDDAEQVSRYAAELKDSTLTVCRLRVEPGELRDRITGRGWQLHLADAAVSNAEQLDQSDFSDSVVDTTGVPAAEVARRIRETGWPGQGDVEVLWLCGPPAVGTSTVGFDVFMQLIADGAAVAYVDLAQLGFADVGDRHRLRAELLGRLWPELSAAGARRLIVVGGVTEQSDVDRYRAAVASGDWTVCRLTAGPQQLTERTLQRGAGGGPVIPGDELRGRPHAELLERAGDSARTAETMQRNGIGDVVVDTSGMTAAEVAEQVRLLL